MISVIVPNYNHLQFLPKRLETIFSQTFQDFEVILLDDCSTDGSWEYLKQFEHHPKVSHCIRNEFNSGSPFKQWKKGLDLAKYDWIWIAESDDFSDFTFLSELVNRIDKQTNLIFCKSFYVDQTDFHITNKVFLDEMKEFEIPHSFDAMDGTQFIKDYLSLRNFILNASSVLFKKPTSFPDRIMFMQFTGDWYFWIFLLKQRGVSYISQPLNFFRFHLNTTRSWKGKVMELKKLQENMDCFNFAFSFFSIVDYFSLNFNYYSILIKKFVKYSRKSGTFRFDVFFPKIPFIFYLTYYKFLFLSFYRG